MRTIIAVIIGFLLVACSEEKNESRNEDAPIVMEEIVETAPVNHFLGCWEERKDTNIIYWCFDSTIVNRGGYIYPYLFQGDTLKIATVKYRFSIEESNLLLLNHLDSAEIKLSKSNLTESPDAF